MALKLRYLSLLTLIIVTLVGCAGDEVESLPEAEAEARRAEYKQQMEEARQQREQRPPRRGR